MKISVVVNLDSRAGVSGETSKFSGHNDGVRHYDLFTAGLVNKLQFFAGFDVELIAFIDEHEPVPDDVLKQVRLLADSVTIRSHSRSYRGADNAGYFNDLNYLRALFQASGEIIVHFDQDVAAFSRDKSAVEKWLSHLDTYAFVSYPSEWSPRAVEDASFGKNTWASTRSFACKRESLQFDELERALREPQWAYATYGTPPRQCPWLEHFLSLLNEESVYYPPRDDENLLIWCWRSYRTGVLPKLNARSFDDVLAYVKMCGSISYPNDLDCLNP